MSIHDRFFHWLANCTGGFIITASFTMDACASRWILLNFQLLYDNFTSYFLSSIMHGFSSQLCNTMFPYFCSQRTPAALASTSLVLCMFLVFSPFTISPLKLFCLPFDTNSYYFQRISNEQRPWTGFKNMSFELAKWHKI